MSSSPSSDGSQLDFSVVIPAFNEATTIADVLERVTRSVHAPGAAAPVEIVVVDDGSLDTTAEIVETFAKSTTRVRLHRHERNRGLEQAIITGCRAVTTDIVVLLDADLSYAPDLAFPMVRQLRERSASAVLASPYMRGGRVANVPRSRLLASRGANFLLSACVGWKLRTFTGMVRAYDLRDLLPILEKTPEGEFNTWIVSELLRTGKRVVEIPADLIWPPERALGTPRLTLKALRRRTGQVVRSIRIVRRALAEAKGLERSRGQKS